MRFPKAGPRAAAVKPEEPAQPIGSAYPGGYDSGHSWRNWHPTARLLAVVCGVEAAVILALCAVIVSLFPLKTVDPVLLTIAPETKFAVEASRLHDRTDALLEMQGAWIRRWADYRYAVIPDNSSMGHRVLWLRQHSAPAVYAEYEKERDRIAVAIKDGVQRDVYDVSVSRTGNDYWILEFAMKDTLKARIDQLGRWRLMVRVALLPPQEATRSEAARQVDAGAYLLGFTVLSAQLSEVK